MWGGRDMSAHCFESLHHKAHLRRGPTKARSTAVQEAPFCQACRNVEKVGHLNGNAHLQVWPCTRVRKTPARRKKRAAETPIAEVEGAVKAAVAEDAAGADGTAQAVSGSCASAWWE